MNNWKLYEFGEIVNLSSAKYYPKKGEQNYPCIELEHIDQGTGRLLGYIDSKGQRSTKNYFETNQVLYGKLRPYLRKYFKPDFNGVCSTEIWVLGGKKNILLNEYLFYLVQTELFNRYTNISSGTKMPRADWSFVNQGVFKIPPLPEQQKIASILSTWDKAIELKEKLIEEKKKKKRGLMQNLLTGEARLPGFEGEWKEARLGDVVDFVKSKPVVNPQDYYLITVKLHLKGIELTDKRPNVTKNGRPYYLRYPNEIIIGRQNFHNGGIALMPENINGYIASNAISSMTVKNADHKFIYYYISDIDFYKKVGDIIGGTGQKEVSESILKKLQIKIPSSKKEQEEIGKILTTADKEISLLEQELEALKQQKKGLMQLLLTGIVRVNTEN